MSVVPYADWFREHRSKGGEPVTMAEYATMLGVSIEDVRRKPTGLGDTIANLAYDTGAYKMAEFYTRMTGKDCGCKGRQEFLNKLVPYGDNK